MEKLPVSKEKRRCMEDYCHGGDIYQQREDMQDWIDFSANINPLGLPVGVRDVIIKNIDKASNYPDPFCRELAQAVSKAQGIDKEHLIFGNGAADIIFRIAMAIRPKKALLIAPSFAEYEKALETVNCKCIFHYLNEESGFELDSSFLDRIDKEKDIEMIFLCNPNNPTGRTIDRSLLIEIVKKCQKKGIFIVVDECFLTMTCEKTMAEYVSKYSKLFILRAFTKDYAMAGIRLGYGINSSRDLLDRIEEMGQPWSVSYIAQIAGARATVEEGYIKKSKELIKREREFLVASLKKLDYKVYTPSANYIFFRIDTETDSFLKTMEMEGFLIRDCGNYRGLPNGGGYFRIAVKCHEDNVKLVGALEKREEALKQITL